jgi:lipoprotein-anchoring transpeptidase ErfK/SrfK
VTSSRLRAATFVALVLGFALLLGCTTADRDATGGSPAPGEASTVVAGFTAAHTPTPLPDRTTCEEIKGTTYRSDSEQRFYLANCVPTPTPVPQVPPPNPPAIPGSEVAGERWILVDIENQTATAMIGERALYSALVTTGKSGWETPRGTFRIGYRVADETMTSVSIGAEEFYVLEHVLYTQYFTNEGHALHLNYWRPDYYFGNIPSSHGCVGMRLADAEFFWNFATNGTRVTIV